MVLCISDGTYYAYKDLNEEEVVSGKGICSYNGETGNFTIISDVDELTAQIADLQEQLEISKGKENLPRTFGLKVANQTSATVNFKKIVIR